MTHKKRISEESLINDQRRGDGPCRLTQVINMHLVTFNEDDMFVISLIGLSHEIANSQHHQRICHRALITVWGRWQRVLG
jgi:hypothetical protein